MSLQSVCRLCLEICVDYKSLYDESDNANEAHQLVIKYFDQKHLLAGSKLNVICLKCWHRIIDFNSFQRSVYQAQQNMVIKVEEDDVSEEEFPADNYSNGYVDDQLDDSNSFAGEWDSEIMDVSSCCDDSLSDDSGEYVVPNDYSIEEEIDNGNDFELPDDYIARSYNLYGTEYINAPLSVDRGITNDNVVYDVFVGGEFGNGYNSMDLPHSQLIYAPWSGDGTIANSIVPHMCPCLDDYIPLY